MTENDLVLKIQDLLKQGKKRKEITEELNITINQYKGLNKKYKFNISIKEDKPYMNKEWLEQQYRKYESAQKIAEICKCSPKVITYWRKKLGIDRAKINYCLRKYVFDENYFEKIDTPEKAYWLGFIMADGCVNIRTENSKRLYIGLSNKDIQHLEKFKKDIKSDHNILVSDVTTNYNIGSNKSIVCSLTINSVKLCNDLIKYGVIPKKSGKEYISDLIPKEFIRDFIRGFFDGDGSAYYYNGGKNIGFSICSSSLLILEQINDVLKNELDIDKEIIKSNNPIYNVDFYEIKISNKKLCKLI